MQLSNFDVLFSTDMSFGERILAVRKKRQLSQEALAKMIGVHPPVIGRYERGEVKPSIETAVKIAAALDVSLDYLVGTSQMETDPSTLERLQEITALPGEEQQQLFMVIDALLRDFKARRVYQN